MTLKDLKVGDRARITGFADVGSARRRKLLALGLTPGAAVAVARLAPLGDPMEVRVHGLTLAVRKSEAATLRVEKL